MIKIFFDLLLFIALDMTEISDESDDIIFVLYVLYSPHPIAKKDANNTTYVAIANLCNAGMAPGVMIKLLFFAYAKNETAMARKPTSISTMCERTSTFCFST